MSWEDYASKAKPPVDDCDNPFGNAVEANRLRGKLEKMQDEGASWEMTDDTYKKIWQLEKDIDRYDRPGGSTTDFGRRRKRY